jgi:hypothetical protein
MTVDVVLDCEFEIEKSRLFLCISFNHSNGFYVTGSTFGFSLISVSYPMVSEVSSYWFGAS